MCGGCTKPLGIHFLTGIWQPCQLRIGLLRLGFGTAAIGLFRRTSRATRCYQCQSPNHQHFDAKRSDVPCWASALGGSIRPPAKFLWWLSKNHIWKLTFFLHLSLGMKDNQIGCGSPNASVQHCLMPPSMQSIRCWNMLWAIDFAISMLRSWCARKPTMVEHDLLVVRVLLVRFSSCAHIITYRYLVSLDHPFGDRFWHH